MAKLAGGLANCVSYGWQLTSNVTVRSPHPNSYQIALNKKSKLSETKGKRVFSTAYKSIIEAENNIFYFRYCNESKRAKEMLDDWVATKYR